MKQEKRMAEIDGKANSERKVGGDVIAERIHLHQAIVSKMKNIGLCTAPKIVETFKRWYLWDYWNVETSRALSLMQLKDAIKLVATISQSNACSMIRLKYNFNSQREFLRVTDGQQKKIIAIAKYNLNISAKDLKTYASKRLGRDPYINKYFNCDITIDEADTLIKALEKWETKQSKKAG